MLVLRNGAGEPEVTTPIWVPSRRVHGVPVARNAAVDHFQADELALWAAGGLNGEQSFTADELALVELEPAVKAGFEDVDLFRDFVAVEAHAGLEAQGVARAQAAGANAELAPASISAFHIFTVVGSSAGR